MRTDSIGTHRALGFGSVFAAEPAALNYLGKDRPDGVQPLCRPLAIGKILVDPGLAQGAIVFPQKHPQIDG